MHKALIVFLAGLGFAAAVTLVSARSSNSGPDVSAHAEIGGPVRLDDRISVAAANTPVLIFTPTFSAGPRIIHIPQPADRAAAGDEGDSATAAIDIDENYVPPPREPLVRRIRPAPPQQHSALPAQQDGVVVKLPAVAPSQKASPAAQGKAAAPNAEVAGSARDLSPIYPTPHFNPGTGIAAPRDPDRMPPPAVGAPKK